MRGRLQVPGATTPEKIDLREPTGVFRDANRRPFAILGDKGEVVIQLDLAPAISELA
jgi:hypothetical protein